MESPQRDREFRPAEEERHHSDSLPSRRDYHSRKNKKRKKKKKNPLAVAQILLAAFIALVAVAIVFSMAHY